MEINEAYAIMSTRTGGMYLDDDSRCYIFTDRKQAEEWSKKIKNTMVSQPRYFKIREMGQECYAYGADVIVLCTRSEEKQFPLGPNSSDREYDNHTLDRLLVRIRQTRRKKLLPLFADERFLIPVQIKDRDGFPEIQYGCAVRKDGKLMYVAFSNLQEFTAWSSRVQGWRVVETGYRELWQIARNHGVIINPFGNRFILKRSMMEDVPPKERTETDDHSEN